MPAVFPVHPRTQKPWPSCRRAATRRFLLDDDGVEADLDAAERLAPNDDDVACAVAALRAELKKCQIVN
jgi:hypothetical protein